MIEYKYKKIKGHDQKKFTENGHTMFETSVLQRLQRLAYLEEQIKQGQLFPIGSVGKRVVKMEVPFTLKGNKYYDLSGNEITTQMLIDNDHEINEDNGTMYIIG